MIENGSLAVIDPDLGGNTAKVGQGVLVGGEEELHGLTEGELDVKPATVRQDHDEKADPSAGLAALDPPGVPPVDLGALTGQEAQGEKGFRHGWTQLADQLPDDGDAAGVTVFAQPLEHLLGGVGMMVKQADDLGPEVIQLGGAAGWFSRLVTRPLQPKGDGLGMEMELAGDLGDGESIA